MKKILAAALVMGVAQNGLAAARQEPDTTAMRELNEVMVQAVKAPKYAPFAVSQIDRKALETFSKTGQELPFLFARTPGVMAWAAAWSPPT